MFKQHDKISPARLTLFKAVFVTDPALGKPIYHEESMLHGLLSIFFFFFFFLLYSPALNMTPGSLCFEMPHVLLYFHTLSLSLLSQPS